MVRQMPTNGIKFDAKTVGCRTRDQASKLSSTRSEDCDKSATFYKILALARGRIKRLGWGEVRREAVELSRQYLAKYVLPERTKKSALYPFNGCT
jgi:hypothetical protein